MLASARSWRGANMPSVRSLVLFSVVVTVVSIVAGALSTLATPDSDGQGADSYGTRGHGFRALYETLSELPVDVQRHLPPPVPFGGATLALLQPDAQLAGVEPSYLESL